MKDKRNIAFICGIAAVVISLLFLVVDVNTIYVIAYIFALIGIISIAVCAYMALNAQDNYPWIMALPRQAILYLAIEFVFSVIIVLFDQLAVWHIDWQWFLIIHAVLFAVFIARTLMLRGGAERVEESGTVKKQEILFIKTLHIDAELLEQQVQDDDVKKQMRGLAEAIKFSDPMSNGSLLALETEIEKKMIALKLAIAGDETDKTETLIKETSLLLQERNKKCMLLK